VRATVKASTLVLGVGNFLLRDEGVGVHVARRLRQETLPPDVEVIDGGTEGFGLLMHWRDRRRVIIVDAIRMAGTPGTVLHAVLTGDGAENAPAWSAHEQSIAALVPIARTIGLDCTVELVGIIPADTETLEPTLSPPLRSALPRIVASVLDLIADPITVR
jgi:hydrogenase maturation protease